MMTERGMLPIGVEFEDRLHREFEIRPQLVKDSIEAMEEERAQKNKNYMALAVMARQVVRLGEIPKEKITAALLMEMYDADLAAMAEAAGRLRARMARFYGGDGGPDEIESGAPAHGI